MLKQVIFIVITALIMASVLTGGSLFAAADRIIDDPAAAIASLSATLSSWTVQDLTDIETREDGSIAFTVTLGQADHRIVLKPYSMRDVDFRVQVQIESGELIDVVAPPPATYRGYVAGRTGSVVAASYFEGQLRAIILFDDGDAWFVEPLDAYDEQAGRSEHVVYHGTDVLPTGFTCGSDLLGRPGEGSEIEFPGTGGSHASPSGNRDDRPQDLKLTEIAFDADFEFFLLNNRDVGNTIRDIEDVLNGVEVAYQRDTEICYDITHIIVRSYSNDPYTSSDPGTLLNQFREHWYKHQEDIQRDCAQLMTGRNLDGNIIGLAWMNGICNNYGYSLVQSRYTGNFDCRIALTAHEVGHNWSAGHCDGEPDCHIMCSGINGCAGVGLPNFGSRAIGEITNFKKSRACIDDGCGSTLDIIEPDPGLADQPNTISVRGAAPGATVEFFFGVAPGTTDVPGCDGLYLGIANARGFAVLTADADGIATVTMNVPPGAAGRTVRLQAADETSCELSDIVVFTFD